MIFNGMGNSTWKPPWRPFHAVLSVNNGERQCVGQNCYNISKELAVFSPKGMVINTWTELIFEWKRFQWTKVFR